MPHSHRPLLAAALLSLAAACEPDPCSDYVDYMCDCHDGEPGVDCQALENTYADAGPDLQDECVIALEDQQDEDAQNGVECDSDVATE